MKKEAVMAKSLMKSILSPVTDNLESESTDGSTSELTRFGSVESGVRVEGSRCQSCDSCGSVDARLDKSAGWTNEKHNSYLDYLEQSFVKRLRRSSSMCLSAKEVEIEYSHSPHDPKDDNYRSNDQLSVRRNRLRQKANFRKKSNASADSSYLKILWISHFPYSRKRRTSRISYGEIDRVGDLTFCCGSKIGSNKENKSLSCREYLIASTAEASDQNFIDEDTEETSHGSALKEFRRTITEDDASSSDQVVPFGKTK